MFVLKVNLLSLWKETLPQTVYYYGTASAKAHACYWPRCTSPENVLFFVIFVIFLFFMFNLLTEWFFKTNMCFLLTAVILTFMFSVFFRDNVYCNHFLKYVLSGSIP